MDHPRGPTLRELALQALSSTRDGYRALAPRFDQTPFRTPDALLQQVERCLGPIEGDALDLCCGTGAATAMLRRLASGRVVGVDFTPEMLAIAAEAVRGVEWVEADARALPFVEAFDVVVSFGAFGHFRVPEQGPLLRGVHRALRPGGRFVFVTAEHPPALHPRVVALRTFNQVMRVRNRLVGAPFVMYYLNFLLPEARARLEAAGFQVTVAPLPVGPLPRARLVVATRSGA